MHTRWRRPLELSRHAPRHIINLTQKHFANGQTEAVASPRIPANRVLTDLTYDHSLGSGSSSEMIQLGIHPTPLTGILSAHPTLHTPIAPPYGNATLNQAWRYSDAQALRGRYIQQTPLANAQGHLHHILSGLTFAGSSSTVSLRDPTASDAYPYPFSRPQPPPSPTSPTQPTPRPPARPRIIHYHPTPRITPITTPRQPTIRTPLRPTTPTPTPTRPTYPSATFPLARALP